MQNNTMFLPIDSLRFTTKRRKGICARRVNEIRMQIERGDDVFPIRVNALGDGTYVVKDGRHRIKAHIEAGCTLIWAVVENILSTIKRFLKFCLYFF